MLQEKLVSKVGLCIQESVMRVEQRSPVDMLIEIRALQESPPL